jgi:hypothetical protein
MVQNSLDSLKHIPLGTDQFGRFRRIWLGTDYTVVWTACNVFRWVWPAEKDFSGTNCVLTRLPYSDGFHKVLIVMKKFRLNLMGTDQSWQIVTDSTGCITVTVWSLSACAKKPILLLLNDHVPDPDDDYRILIRIRPALGCRIRSILSC